MRALCIILTTIAAGTLIFSGSNDAKAWGKFGHLTICDLAYRNLTKKTRSEFDKLFEIKSGGIDIKRRDGVAVRHYTSFNLGCLEEDAFPRKHKKDHFINVTRSTKSIDSNDCPGGKSCILSGIQRDLKTLKDGTKSNEERVFALMAIGHWIGDIHQPLHVSFKDDRGGNSIDVKLKGRCGTSKFRPKNLHAVWDNCLLEAGMFERVRKRADFKKTWGKNTITYRAVDTLQANTTLTDERALVGADPWNWASESYAITLQPDTQYCVMVGDACQYSKDVKALEKNGIKRTQKISQTYLKKFRKVAQERVRKAGIRLAHIVNLALDPDYKKPIQNSTQNP